MAKHISIRVPWHDNEWSGSVCKCPENNPFCMVLRNIADSKNVDNEMGLAGRKWCELSSEQLPACKGERTAVFMSLRRIGRHGSGLWRIRFAR